jgi:predicted TIM-barrel fold metal-dependent hydrolase
MKSPLIAAVLLFAITSFAGEPVFDSHVHLRDYETSLLAYESEVKEAGITLAGAGVMWFGGEHQAPAGNTTAIRAGNDRMLALAAKHPEIIPIATVHPYDGQAAIDELARVAARGIHVLKIHPHTQKFAISDPRVLALVTKAGELGVTVLFDNAGIVPGDCQDLFNLAVAAPKTRFIFAHMGAAEFRFWNILPLARTADGFALSNVNFDISGTVWLVADSPIEAEFVWTLRNVGIEHVMLGSDYPQMSLARMNEALEKLDLTADEKTKIRSGNATRIMGGSGK